MFFRIPDEIEENQRFLTWLVIAALTPPQP